jgi:hypothetical protein
MHKVGTRFIMYFRHLFQNLQCFFDRKCWNKSFDFFNANVAITFFCFDKSYSILFYNYTVIWEKVEKISSISFAVFLKYFLPILWGRIWALCITFCQHYKCRHHKLLKYKTVQIIFCHAHELFFIIITTTSCSQT